MHSSTLKSYTVVDAASSSSSSSPGSFCFPFRLPSRLPHSLPLCPTASPETRFPNQSSRVPSANNQQQQARQQRSSRAHQQHVGKQLAHPGHTTIDFNAFFLHPRKDTLLITREKKEKEKKKKRKSTDKSPFHPFERDLKLSRWLATV